MFKAQIEDLVQAVSDSKNITEGDPPAIRPDAKEVRSAINALSV